MKAIKNIEILDLKIPFIAEFRHHTASRKITQTVIVIADDGNLKGYGEGCPREYVTGESIETCSLFFNKIKYNIIHEIHDLDGLKVFREKNISSINKNHSAWCAIELALLDLFAKQQKCSIEKLLEVPELKGEFRYTAIIGDDNFEEFKRSADRYCSMGFNDYKIKLDGNKQENFKKLNYLINLNNKFKVRVDANNLWEHSRDVMDFVNSLPCSIAGIEEPLKSKNINELVSLAEKIRIPIILDESFYLLENLNTILTNKDLFIINLRVSKMGGLLNSLEIANLCKMEDQRVIVGAQVGETSILTRSGLCIANYLAPKLMAHEGAFGTMLLVNDIVENSLMFGQDGVLICNQLLYQDKFGLQLDVLNSALKKA